MPAYGNHNRVGVASLTWDEIGLNTKIITRDGFVNNIS